MEDSSLRPPEDAPTPEARSADWHDTALVVAVSVVMQTAVWSVLWALFGAMRIGYGFFDLNDISGTYLPYALKIAEGMSAYRDFFVEYPPLFIPLLVAAGNPQPEAAFVLRFAGLMLLFMLGAGAVTAVAALDSARPARPYLTAAVFSACVLALGPIAVNRYDASVELVLAIALLLMLRSRWVAAGVVIGIGFALKITPAMLLPIVLILAPPRRAGWAFLGFCVAGAAPFLWVLSLHGQSMTALREMLTYHLTRPLEIESVLATPLWIAKLAGEPVTVGFAAGSQVIQSMLAEAIAKASGAVVLVALGSTFSLVLRRRASIAASPRLIALATLATLLSSLVGSKVLSPQYLVWLIPAIALVALDRKVLGVLLGAALLLTHVLFPANYWAFATQQLPGPIAIVIARNLLLVASLILSLYYLWKVPKPAR